MKKTFLVFMAMSLFLWAGSVFAYDIDDNTLVRKKTSHGGAWGDWTDVIGNSAQFEVYGMDVTISAADDSITFDMYTNFNHDGIYELEETRYLTTYSLYVNVADLALDVNRDGTYEYGIVLKDHTDWAKDKNSNTEYAANPTAMDLNVGLYSGTTWDTSAHFIEDETVTRYDYIYGGKWDQGNPKDPNVAIAGGTWVNSLADLTIPTGSDIPYTWSVKIAALDLGVNLNTDFDFDVFWGGATCANDVIAGTVHYEAVPEPSTMLLLGSGLIGLAGLGRKKFFKNG